MIRTELNGKKLKLLSLVNSSVLVQLDDEPDDFKIEIEIINKKLKLKLLISNSVLILLNDESKLIISIRINSSWTVVTPYKVIKVLNQLILKLFDSISQKIFTNHMNKSESIWCINFKRSKLWETFYLTDQLVL